MSEKTWQSAPQMALYPHLAAYPSSSIPLEVPDPTGVIEFQAALFDDFGNLQEFADQSDSPIFSGKTFVATKAGRHTFYLYFSLTAIPSDAHMLVLAFVNSTSSQPQGIICDSFLPAEAAGHDQTPPTLAVTLDLNVGDGVMFYYHYSGSTNSSINGTTEFNTKLTVFF